MTLVAYYRVSTQRQGTSGLGLESQRAAVRAYARAAKRKLVEEFTEVESGRKNARPKLTAALARARAAGATLVVAKLDRLTRDARFLFDLADGDVPIHFLDLPDLSVGSAVGRMVLGFMGHVAEFESRRIGERVKAAWQARLARKEMTGRERSKKARAGRLGAAEMHRRERAAVAAFRARHLPLVARLRATMTLAAVAAELNRVEVTTRRGNPWTAGLVWALLRKR